MASIVLFINFNDGGQIQNGLGRFEQILFFFLKKLVFYLIVDFVRKIIYFKILCNNAREVISLQRFW